MRSEFSLIELVAIAVIVGIFVALVTASHYFDAKDKNPRIVRTK